jgi:hypothetical protein
MKNEVATHVMGLVNYDCFKRHGIKKLMHDSGKTLSMKRISHGSSRRNVHMPPAEEGEEAKD